MRDRIFTILIAASILIVGSVTIASLRSHASPAPAVAQAIPPAPATAPAPKLPDSILDALQASVKSNPPAKGEKWLIGPASDMVMKTPSYENTDDGHVVVHYAQSIFVNHNRALGLELRGQNLTVDGAYAVWSRRLHGVIADSEIAVAHDVLEDARQKFITVYAGRGNNEGDDPLGARAGDKFQTKVLRFGHGLIIIYLYWIDNYDPELAKLKPIAPTEIITSPDQRD